MKYAVEMGSCVIIYIRSFIKIGSGFLNFWGRGADTQTDRETIALAHFRKGAKN
jgi:hypothetical protein